MPECGEVRAEIDAVRDDLSAFARERDATILDCYEVVRRRFDIVTDRAVYRELDAICTALLALRVSPTEEPK